MDVQTRIANRTLTLLNYLTDPDLFVPDLPEDDHPRPRPQSLRVVWSTLKPTNKMRPSTLTQNTDTRTKPRGKSQTTNTKSTNARDESKNPNTCSACNLKPTLMRRIRTKKQIPPETDEHRRIHKMMEDHVRKNEIVDNMIVRGQKVKDLMMQYKKKVVVWGGGSGGGARALGGHYFFSSFSFCTFKQHRSNPHPNRTLSFEHRHTHTHTHKREKRKRERGCLQN